MSDPVTNVEIEDVLSSIRRLVSEDARVRPLLDKASDRVPDGTGVRGDALADDIAPTREAPGKLVLTPALRVTDSEIAPPEQDDSAGDLPADETRSGDMRHDDMGQETGAAAADADQPVPAEQAPLFDDALPDTLDHDASAEPSATVNDVQDVKTESESEVGSAEHAADALPWEDHQDESHYDARKHALLLDEAASIEVADEAYDVWPEDAGAEAPQATAAPLRDADGSSSGPSGGGVFSSIRDGGEQGGTAKEDATEDFAEGDASDSLFADDDTILDEEMLRELVTEIVRQELQGALGERITRNVRKLVRREIHRALTSHELE